MKLKKGMVILVGTLTITIMGISSAEALQISNPLAKVFDQWQSQLSSLNKYITSKVSRQLDNLSASLSGDLKGEVNKSVGVLGLPSATEVREKVENIARMGKGKRSMETAGEAGSEITLGLFCIHRKIIAV